MFLTISIFWQWQNKQLLFFSKQILNPQATFFKWHPNIVATDFVLLFHCRLGMSYWQLKSIHGDQVMRTRISEQPDNAHHMGWWRQGAGRQISALILQDLSGNTFHCTVNGCWMTLLRLSYFARFSPRGVQNFLNARGCRNPFLRCRLTTRPADQFTPFGGCRFTAQTGLHFICSLYLYQQVTTKPKNLLQTIIMHKPPKSWSPVAKYLYI